MRTKRTTSTRPIVLSVGGSVVNPGTIDRKFLQGLRAVLLRVARLQRLGVVVGGGQPARLYQEAARKLGIRESAALDWIGLRATQLNAEFIRQIVGLDASPVVMAYTRSLPKHRIVIGAGDTPGHSTDFTAVLLAEKLGAKTIYNLSNIDYVFDRDPAKHKTAKPLKDLSWREYVKQFPLVYKPGLHTPFDPQAVRRARKNGMTVVVLNGKSIANFQAALAGKPFRGTVIHP